MWPGEQRKNHCHRFLKTSSVPFPSLIAKEFSGHFYYGAREAFAPESGKTSGAFCL